MSIQNLNNPLIIDSPDAIALKKRMEKLEERVAALEAQKTADSHTQELSDAILEELDSQENNTPPVENA